MLWVQGLLFRLGVVYFFLYSVDFLGGLWDAPL